MALMQNAYAPTQGLLEVREGYSIVATGITFGPVLALAGYKDDSNGQSLLAVAAGGSATDNLKFYEWNGTAAVFTFVDSLTGYTAQDAKIEMIRVTDQVSGSLANKRAMIISTDQQGITRKYFDGSAVDDCHWGGAGDELNRAHEYSGGRLIAAGNDADSDSLFHSDMHSCTTTGMDVTAARQFRMGGGNPSSTIVTARVFRGNKLIVFMDDAIEIISMDSSTMAIPGNPFGLIAGGFPLIDWSRGTVHNRIGCGAWNSVANVGADMFFLDQDMQVRSIAMTISDAQSGVDNFPISEPIKDYLARINPVYRDLCVATHFERYYILSVPLDSATTADTIFVLDVAQTARQKKPVWYGPWTDFDARCFGVMKMDSAALPADQNPTLYFGQNVTTDGLVMRAFSGTTDNGNPILFKADYPRETMGAVELIKVPRLFRYYGASVAAVTVEVFANCDNQGFQSIGFVDTSGGAPALPQDLPFTLGGTGIVTDQFFIGDEVERCRDVQFRMTATASEGLKVAGYSFFAHLDNYSYENEQ